MRRWVGLGVLAMTVVSACDDSTESTSAGTGGSTASAGGTPATSNDATAYCDAVIAPMCEALFACCTDPMRLDQKGGSVESCKAQEMAACLTSMEERQAFMDSGDTLLNVTRLNECAAAVQAIADGPDACSEPPLTQAVACLGAFEGQRAVGSDCSDVHDDVAFTVCDGGYCDEAGKCTAFIAPGAPCEVDGSAYCDPYAGQWCIAETGATGVCGDRLAEGAPCVPETGSKTWACKSLTCDGTCIAPDPARLCVSNT